MTELVEKVQIVGPDGTPLAVNADGSIDVNGGGGGGAPTDATYITQTPSAGLSAEQAMSALATGLVKNATGTGVQSIAAQGVDYYAPGGTDVAVADGGTGASTAAAAIAELGVGSLVQVIPLTVGTAGSYTLSTSLNAVGNTRFGLVPGDWTMLSGKTPQVRAAAWFGNGVTSGDVLELDMYDADGAVSLASGTVTTSGTWSTNRMTIVRTSLIAMPTKTGCYLRARNQTGARGLMLAAFLEISYL